MQAVGLVFDGGFSGVLAAMREEKFQKKKGAIPFSLLLHYLGSSPPLVFCIQLPIWSKYVVAGLWFGQLSLNTQDCTCTTSSVLVKGGPWLC